MASPLSRDQLAHIAALARLELTEDELALFEHQFTDILAAFEGLQKTDTSGVAELHQVTGLTSVLRSDEVRTVATREEMLASARHPIVGHQIRVPSPHGIDA